VRVAPDLTGTELRGARVLRCLGRRNNRPLYLVRCGCGQEHEMQQPHVLAAMRGEQKGLRCSFWCPGSPLVKAKGDTK
jgi:hypothetical protein